MTQVEALAMALQKTSHKHPWKDCEFKDYFLEWAERLLPELRDVL